MTHLSEGLKELFMIAVMLLTCIISCISGFGFGFRMRYEIQNGITGISGKKAKLSFSMIRL